MNLYIENAGIFKNVRRIRKCVGLLKQKEALDLYIISRRAVSYFALSWLVLRNKRIGSITLIQYAKKVTPDILYFANRVNRFSLQLIVDHKLRAKEWERIASLKRIIYIHDISGEKENCKRYQNNRFVVWDDGSRCGLQKPTAWTLLSGGAALDCAHTSCLGNTIFISRQGEISFCPRHPEKSRLKQLNGQLFECETFLRMLEEIIARRETCRATCRYYALCKGGCAFEKDCTLFQQEIVAAEADLEGFIQKQVRLDSVPFYQEEAIIRRLFLKPEVPAPNKDLCGEVLYHEKDTK